MSSQNWNAYRARKTQTMKKIKEKISLFNELNFALVDYTDMNLFCAANFGESYYNDSKVEKESLFGQHNFEQSYYVNGQNKNQPMYLLDRESTILSETSCRNDRT